MNQKSESNVMNSMPGLPSKTNFESVHPVALRPRTAGEAIQLAVDAVENTALTPLSPNSLSPLSQARAVLALLVNCYAHQIYSSRNAAALAARDPDFPWLWWEDFPDATALRRFRTENHAAIHHSLTTALELLAVQKKSAGYPFKIRNPQFAAEADRRITMAAFVDSVELDEE